MIMVMILSKRGGLLILQTINQPLGHRPLTGEAAKWQFSSWQCYQYDNRMIMRKKERKEEGRKEGKKAKKSI